MYHHCLACILTMPFQCSLMVWNGTLRAKGKDLDRVSQTGEVRRAVEVAYESQHRLKITHGDVAICAQEATCR